MDKLATGNVMTTKEVAEALGLKDSSSVTRVAKKCLPDKVIQNGKTTLWSEEELTVLLDYLQNHRSDRTDLTSAYLSGGLIETSQTKVFEIQKAYAQMQAASENVANLLNAYIADLQAENSELKSDKEQLQVALDTSKSFASVKLMEKLNPNRKFDWRVLKNKSKELSCAIKKCIDQNYGEVNAYAKEVWEACYELDATPWD